MNIQGIGQSYSAYSSSYSSPGAQGIKGMQGGGFDPSSMTADKIIEKEDANLDGVLSADETRLTAEMFADADSDSDGTLTVDELEEMLASGPPAGGGMMGMGGMMPPPAEGNGPESMSIESILEKEDADGDGKISAEESMLPDDLFSEIDADQDGLLTAEEIEKSHENKKEPPDRAQSTGSGMTATQDAAIKAYQQAIQSFLLNFSGSSEDGSAILTSVLNTIA
ncbi:MAG: EF-hand domain-containing protein [Desulfobacula sp.]|jgi:Ca2+-binding EF-hand superfamily protein